MSTINTLTKPPLAPPPSTPAAAPTSTPTAPSAVVVVVPPAAGTVPVAYWQIALLAGVLAWAYLPMLQLFFDKWVNDPQYSHGLLVPLFSAYLLRRAWRVGPVALAPLPWLGCFVLAFTLLMRAAAGSLLFHQLDAAAFLVSLFALVIVAGGVPLLRRTTPAILFLVFMVPLPFELERNVGQPLKVAATVSSTFLLQTLGQPAVRDGNVILIDEVRLGVVDACSGLKMMVTFAAFSVGAVMIMGRTRFERLMVLLGIIPIAIIANVLRITATGLSYVWFTDTGTVEFLHDLHGWLMMPVGLALLGLEMWCLKRLVVQDN